MQETWVQSLSWVDPLEKEMAIHCNILGASHMVLAVKKLSANAGDLRDSGSIPDSGRSAGGHGNPLQYFCLGNLMDRGAWWATAHRVAKSQTQLK